MRCRYCDKDAIIKTREGYLCEEHFKRYYLRTIQRTIDRYKMFSKRDRILIAVSGGKDSMSLAHALNELGYEFEGLFINLGIKGYSDYCEKVVREFFENIDKKLNIIYAREYGVRVQRIGSRPTCSVCGIIKRYLMNKFAYENGFDVLVTGHNLSDEVAFFFSNIVGQNIEYLVKQGPVSEKGPKLVKKVKPQYFIPEEENRIYVKINNIQICDISCPLSVKNKQRKWKEISKIIEIKYKDFSYHFSLGMLKVIKNINLPKKEWKFCKICGYPTESKDGICAFCKIRLYLERQSKNTSSKE